MHAAANEKRGRFCAFGSLSILFRLLIDRARLPSCPRINHGCIGPRVNHGCIGLGKAAVSTGAGLDQYAQPGADTFNSQSTARLANLEGIRHQESQHK